MDKDIEATVKNCTPCQATQKLPPAATIQPWEWPKRPWARLHIDYAGPLNGQMFLVVVDAYSKWMEVKMVKQANSRNTISILQSLFATHGLPELVVSDNGTVFTSTEFKQYMQLNGIRHSTAAPYHPATNGLAERAVQTFNHSSRKRRNSQLKTASLNSCSATG